MPKLKLNKQEFQFVIDVDKYDDLYLVFMPLGDTNKESSEKISKKLLKVLQKKLHKKVSIVNDTQYSGFVFRIPEFAFTELLIKLLK